MNLLLLILYFLVCGGKKKQQIYKDIEDRVISYLKKISNHKNIVRIQGSGSLAIEIALAKHDKP